MKLHLYRGLENIEENVPSDVTHIIVEETVTTINEFAFYQCSHLVSVIASDNLKRIESYAFMGCRALKIVRLSKILQYLGEGAFDRCVSLEALFLPSKIKSTGHSVFSHCRSLRCLILPNEVDISYTSCKGIIRGTAIQRIAAAAGVAYYGDPIQMHGFWSEESKSNHKVNKWLASYMDKLPLHKLCYKSSVTTDTINNYRNENGKQAALQIDPYHGMTPLHILAMNPFAPPETMSAIFESNVETAFYLDYRQNTPLDYARDYNVGGLVGMIAALCRHRNAT